LLFAILRKGPEIKIIPSKNGEREREREREAQTEKEAVGMYWDH